MNPKQLKSPFSWANRKPHFEDRVLYVPKYYHHHQDWSLPCWSDPILFGNDNPISIEFCSGNGLWVFERALAHEKINWIAVEKRFDRVRKIWAKIKNYNLKNLIVVCGEAESFANYYVKENAVSEVYINFPDPWPKSKHAKNRIFQQPFIKTLSKICQKDAKGVFVTDDEGYSSQIIEEMHQSNCWKSNIPAPFFVTDYQEYGTSYFDELFRSQGKQIRYMEFLNTKSNYE